MPKLPRITSKKLIAALRRQGFFVHHQRGSHVIMLHRDGRMAVVPMHARDIPIGTLSGILKDIEWSIEDLRGSL